MNLTKNLIVSNSDKLYYKQIIMVSEMMPYTFEEVSSCKNISEAKVKADYKKLCDFEADTNPRKFCGNPTIYQYQMKNLLNCRRGTKNYKTLQEWFDDPELKEKLWQDAIKRNRRKNAIQPSPTDVYECHRLNNGAIVPFKASTAKYIYKKFGAKKVLDPTAGWGGRLLGASALGIDYVGIDTNINLKEGYEKMISDLNLKGCEMIWKSCFDVDFREINPDLVLTSPPYGDMEIYEHMTPWGGWTAFFYDFMIPLMEKLFKECKCPVCINMSPFMYEELTKWRQIHDCRKINKERYFPPCDEKIDLRQQMGKQFKTKSQDYIYVWWSF